MKRITRLGGTAAAAIALTVGGLVLVPSAASAASATPDDTASCAVPWGVVALWQRVPEELRQDLSELRTLPEGERAEAARQIREDALEGGYGEAVQNGAERLRDLRLLRWSAAPKELRDDLREIRAADAGARAELVQAVVERALAGEYGDAAQRRVERFQESELWRDCVAK